MEVQMSISLNQALQEVSTATSLDDIKAIFSQLPEASVAA